MNKYDPIALLYGGMDKLGPGDDASTKKVLELLPRRNFHLVVDAGCGTGRQTLVLANTLNTLIHAIDMYEPFLTELTQRAKKAGLSQYVKSHCMDMQDIPDQFHNIDLLWAEGSIYNIGFQNALESWAPALSPDGLLVVSELTWISEHVPDKVKTFFEAEYAAMQAHQENLKLIAQSGYQVLTTYTLSRESWNDGYYEVLKPRAESLMDHEDASVRELAKETLNEIEIYDMADDSYAYIFYVLERSS